MESSNKLVLSEKVYEHVLQMILKQEIKCGEKIPEEKITQMLGISRTPIREALRRLANDGIVNIFPKRYAEVITFDEESIKNLGIMRVSLDTLAGRLAINYGSNADFNMLKDIVDQCYEATKKGDVYSRIKFDCDFHLKLTEIASNPLLLKFQKQLYLQVHLFQATRYINIEDSLKKIEGHFEIIDALYKRDEEAVVKSIQNHLITFYNLGEIPNLFKL